MKKKSWCFWNIYIVCIIVTDIVLSDIVLTDIDIKPLATNFIYKQGTK